MPAVHRPSTDPDSTPNDRIDSAHMYDDHTSPWPISTLWRNCKDRHDLEGNKFCLALTLHAGNVLLADHIHSSTPNIPNLPHILTNTPRQTLPSPEDSIHTRRKQRPAAEQHHSLAVRLQTGYTSCKHSNLRTTADI
jgi:hypothetical protein